MPHTHASQCGPDSIQQHHPPHLSPLSPDRDTNADSSAALCQQVGKHAIETRGGQH